MEKLKIGLEAIQALIIIFGVGFGLYQYQKEQKFKRLQNLSGLWRNFFDNESLLHLFNLMDEIERGDTTRISALKEFDPKIKFKYLALIEEVSLYATEFEVDQDQAQYLFQWHFFFPYQSHHTSTAFWNNLGGVDEMNASYWRRSKDLSKSFSPH